MRYIGLLLLLFSCGPTSLTKEELTAYIRQEGNGLYKTQEANGYKAEVTYRPTDLWVAQELNDKQATAVEVDNLRKKYSHYYYFILSLSRDNKEALHSLEGGMDQYSELVNVLSFRMADYVTMTTNANDTIPVGDFILNRTYGMSSTTDLLFVFNKEKAKDKNWVQFNLNEFGLGLGNQRFRFARKDLDNTPTLNFITDNQKLTTNN